jgi:hypothetical protein
MRAAAVAPELDGERLEAARRASSEVVRHTPVLTAASLSEAGYEPPEVH